MAGFDGIFNLVAQDKAFVYGLASNAISYAQSRKAQARAYNYARLLQQQQYDLTQQGYRESPGNMRTGLESAGYNPMLAIQNGSATGGVNVSGGSPVSSFAPESPNLVSNATDVLRLKNETEQTEAINDVNYANADKAKAEKAILVEKLPYVSKQAKADYMKTAMESAKLENDIHYQDEQLNLLKKQIQVQQTLGEMGFANAKDVARIQASAQRYSANKSFAGTKYSADTSANSTPFKYFSNKVDKYGRSYFNWWK